MMKSKKQNLEQISRVLREQVIETKSLVAIKGGGDPPDFRRMA